MASQTIRYTQPADLFHLDDGRVVRMEGYQLNAVLQAGFADAYNSQTNRCRIFRVLVDRLKSWTNLGTFVDLIDDVTGTMKSLTKDIKRQTACRGSYAQVILESLRQKAEKLLVDFSLRAGNTTATVKP